MQGAAMLNRAANAECLLLSAACRAARRHALRSQNDANRRASVLIRELGSRFAVGSDAIGAA